MSRIMICAVLAVLAGCATTSVDESTQRVELATQTAEALAKSLQSTQSEPGRETVEFSTRPWVSKKPISAPVAIPHQFDCSLQWRPAMPVSISDIARHVSRHCNIPVLVSPDALKPNSDSSVQQQSQTSTTNNNLAGLLPSAVQSAALASPNEHLIHGLRWEGSVSGLLDSVTAQLGLSWRYNHTSNSIRVSFLETRVFDVHAFGDEQSIETTIQSGMTSSAGVSGGSSSGSGTSDSGVSGSSGSNHSTTTSLRSSLLADIRDNVQAMLSRSGQLFLAPSTGSLTVTDRPDVLDRVELYIDKANQSIARQVLFNVKVFEVVLKDEDQLGLNWEAAYQSLSSNWGVSLVNSVPGMSSNAVSGSVNILDTANSAWAGSSAVIQALSQQGRIANVRSPSVTTLNLQPAPIQIGNVQGYLASSSTTTTASVGSSTALTPGTITSGFNMTLLPRVIGEDELLLMVSINMSSKPTFQTFTSNGNSLQLPEYDAKSLSPKVRLRSGQTLILSGFDEITDDATHTGVGSPRFFGLGGGVSRTSTHSVLVVLITPILMT